MDILNLRTPLLEDDSLTRWEYHSVIPYSSSSFNNNDEIRIVLQQQDIITLPSESRLYVEGVLTKNTQHAYGREDGLSDNAVLHLFSEIRYELNGIVIDRVRNPGITSLIKGLLTFTSNDESAMINSSFIVENKQNEHFSFCVPLKIILGFAEDYKKVLFNVKQEIILVRARTDNNAYTDTSGDKELAISLNTIQWQIPFINVNDTHRLNFLNILKKNTPIQMGFRTWQLYEYPNISNTTTSVTWPVRLSSAQEKPRFVVIGFQKERKDVLNNSASLFDHCNISKIRLHVGSECYPYVPLTADFVKDHIAILYENFLNFRKSYYQGSYETSGPRVSRQKFKDSYPLWVIDCSRQNEIVKTGGIDIRVDIEAQDNFPTNTSAYCLIISDAMVEYVPFTGIVRPIF